MALKSQSGEAMEWAQRESAVNDQVSSGGEVSSLVSGEEYDGLANVLGESGVGKNLELLHDLLRILTPAMQQSWIDNTY